MTKYEKAFPLGCGKVKSGEIVLILRRAAPGRGRSDKILAYEKQAPESGGHVLMQDGKTIKKMTADEFKAAKKAGKGDLSGPTRRLDEFRTWTRPRRLAPSRPALVNDRGYPHPSNEGQSDDRHRSSNVPGRGGRGGLVRAAGGVGPGRASGSGWA